LGDGTTTTRNSPVLVDSEFNSNIIQIAAGQYHTMFLRSNGRAYGFGRNNVIY